METAHNTIHLSNIIIPSLSPNEIDNLTEDPTPPVYDITIINHSITSVTLSSTPLPACNADTHPSTSHQPPPSLLLPSLTHPHLHLDKPYLLTSHSCNGSTQCQFSTYNDLVPQSGTFAEALTKTAEAKTRFTSDDLLLRGRQLLATAFTQGVTSVRAFVEVDHVVREMCVEVGLRLQEEFWSGGVGQGSEEGDGKDVGDEQKDRRLVKVQLCAFAQDPIFSTEFGEENRALMEGVLERYAASAWTDADRLSTTTTSNTSVEKSTDANNNAQESPARTILGQHGIEVLGTTPYVETSRAASLANIEWAIVTALRLDLHLDFHLDYNLDPSIASDQLLVWEVLRLLKRHGWPTISASQGGKANSKRRRTVVLGHCSALSLLSHRELQRLAAEIKDSNLPVYFVGLPTSDLYMMGRPQSLPDVNTGSGSPSDATDEEDSTIYPLNRPRGTLLTTYLHQQYGIKAVLGINNVGNAFTPYGTGDPLEMASWCVGLQQDGTERGVRELFWAISSGAREAIGLEDGSREAVEVDGNIGDQREAGHGKQVGWVRQGMDIGDFGVLIVRNEEFIRSSTSEALNVMKVPARQRYSVRDVVWDVPRIELRKVVR